jgi:hypothetical protein
MSLLAIPNTIFCVGTDPLSAKRPCLFDMGGKCRCRRHSSDMLPTLSAKLVHIPYLAVFNLKVPPSICYFVSWGWIPVSTLKWYFISIYLSLTHIYSSVDDFVVKTFALCCRNWKSTAGVLTFCLQMTTYHYPVSLYYAQIVPLPSSSSNSVPSKSCLFSICLCLFLLSLFYASGFFDFNWHTLISSRLLLPQFISITLTLNLLLLQTSAFPWHLYLQIVCQLAKYLAARGAINQPLFFVGVTLPVYNLVLFSYLSKIINIIVCMLENSLPVKTLLIFPVLCRIFF